MNKYLTLFLFVAALTIGISIFSTVSAKNLTNTGSYQVTLANPANHLNCRTGPGTHFPIRTRLEHGESIIALHTTLHSKPWFYTNLRCFVRASSSFLKWLGVEASPADSIKDDKPEVIR